MEPGQKAVDDYIATFPAEVQAILQEVRRTIHAASPGSAEKISYQIVKVTLGHGGVIFLGGWKRHIGLYPVPRSDDPIEADIAPYRATKDTVRLPLGKPIPYELIARIVATLEQCAANAR